MITLVLVRHAKSDWGAAGQPDHDRPLNERGLRDAPQMAAALAESGFVPDRLLTSTAVRAHTTAASFAGALGVALEDSVDLYGASAREIWAVAAATGAQNVLVVAHDPGLSDLASDLADREILMTTCAVATFRIPAEEWSETPPVVDEWSLDAPR